MLIYKEVTILLILIFLIYKWIKKDYNLFEITIFLAPFTAISFKLGVNLTLYQILLSFLLLHFLFQSKINFKNVSLNIFLLYSIFSTIFISVFIIEDYIQLGNYFRSEGRFITQIILFLLNFSIIFIAYKYLETIQSIHKILKVLLEGMVLLSLLGWLQFSVYQIIHLDIFPIYIKNGLAISGVEQSLNIFRISSLSHEPKGLAVFITIAFFILYSLNNNNIKVFKYDLLIKILFTITIFATLSTSGLVMFGMLFFLIFILNIHKFKINYKKISILLILLIIILYNQQFIVEIIELRILNRDLTSEDFDAPIQIFLSKFPEYLFFGSGMGNIHNLSADFIPLKYLHYMKDNIFVAKSGYLTLISEYGVIGLILFLAILINLLINLQKYIKIYNYNIFYSMKEILILVTVAYFTRSYAYSVFIIIIAITNASVNLRINEITNKEKNEN